jgi:hypothetical protein
VADETIKIAVEVDPSNAQRGAQQVGQALDGVGSHAEGAGRQIARAFSQVEWAALRENVGAVFGTIRDGAASLSRSAGEAERLSRSGRAIGVDFDAAARAAGGVVDSLDVLNASQTLTARGISLNQAQLQAFARTAQDYARGTGREFSQVAEQLAEAVAKGGEEAGRFGPALGALAAPTATAQDRLAALVETTRQSAPAAQTAAEAYRDLEQALTDAQRGFGEGFAEGIAEMRRVHGETSSARDVMRELKDDVYALGGATATVFGAMADAARLVVTEIGGMVSGLTDAVDTFGQLRQNPLQAGEILRGFQARTDAREAASQAAFERLMGTLGGSSRTSLTVDDAAAAGGAARRGRGLIAEGEAGATGAGGTEAELQAFLRAQTARGGAANTNAQKNVIGLGMERAIRGEGSLSEELRGITGVSRGDAAAPIGDPLAEIDQRNAQTNRRVAGGTLGDRLDARESSRRQREVDEQLNAQQSYTDRMRDMHTERASLARSEAEAVTMGFNAMGKALGNHLHLVVQGQETVGFAAQAMASDIMVAVGQEAIVKGAMQFAEGAAMLAGIYTAPLAAGHFAAGAAFMGVGALVGAAGAAIAPTPAGASAAPAVAPSAPVGALGSANDNSRGGPTEITINLGGGVVLGTGRDLGEALGRAINDPNAGVQINPRRLRRTG